MLGNDLIQVRELFGKVSESVLIGSRIRIAQQRRDFLMAVCQCIELCEKGSFQRRNTETDLLKGRTLVPLIVKVREPEHGSHSRNIAFPALFGQLAKSRRRRMNEFISEVTSQTA